MITKIAFLPRILPALFRLAPVATTAGYAMPHERFFFYGISVSALLHVAVFYGFPPESAPVVRTPVLAEEVINALPFGLVEEEPPPPPETAPEVEEMEEANAANEAGEEFAHLPTPIIDVDPGMITIPGKVELGKLPNKDSVRWDPPKRPGTGSGAKVNGCIFRLDELDKRPSATNCVAPRYPSEAKRLGYSGKVVMRFIVDARGNVSDVEIVSSDHLEFNRAAVEAMLRWRFNPGMKNNRRVSTRMEMPMVFSLSNDA